MTVNRLRINQRISLNYRNKAKVNSAPSSLKPPLLFEKNNLTAVFRPQTCAVWLMFAVAVIRHTPPLQPVLETAIAFTVLRRSRAVKKAFKHGSAPLFPPTATNAVNSDPAQFAAATRLTTRFRRKLGLRGASPAPH